MYDEKKLSSHKKLITPPTARVIQSIGKKIIVAYNKVNEEPSEKRKIQVKAIRKLITKYVAVRDHFNLAARNLFVQGTPLMKKLSVIGKKAEEKLVELKKQEEAIRKEKEEEARREKEEEARREKNGEDEEGEEDED